MGAMPASPGPAIPRDTQVNPQVAGLVLRRALEHAHEVDSAALTVAGGDQVEILCMEELRDWLSGLAARVEAGEPL